MAKKRFLMGMAALLVLAATPAFAQSEADFEVGLTDDSAGVVIKKYIGKVAAVKIPATIQDMPVREIGAEAFGSRNRPNDTITSVVIPVGVTLIGGSAFQNCQKLVQVTLPDGLTSIGGMAFYECAALQAVTLPDSVIEIKKGRNDYSDGGMFARSGITSITWSSGLKFIPEATFSQCSRLAKVVIPEGVTTIYSNAFTGCAALTSITLPSTIRDISGNAFIASGLTSVVIPEGVTEIGRETFASCSELTSVTLPSTIKKIGGETFRRCSSLTTITVPDSVTAIQFIASYDRILTFDGCTKLTLAAQVALRKAGYTGGF
jgi:hypothetical protein